MNEFIVLPMAMRLGKLNSKELVKKVLLNVPKPQATVILAFGQM